MFMASYDDQISEPVLTEFTTNVYFQSTRLKFWPKSSLKLVFNLFTAKWLLRFDDTWVNKRPRSFLLYVVYKKLKLLVLLS